jgi:hypothetical protein
VRRELGVDVRLARALGTQFDEVVVAFAVGNEAHKLHQLGAPAVSGQWSVVSGQLSVVSCR